MDNCNLEFSPTRKVAALEWRNSWDEPISDCFPNSQSINQFQVKTELLAIAY